jgi:ABC-type oligopeptide transport system ATPase subunit
MSLRTTTGAAMQSPRQSTTANPFTMFRCVTRLAQSDGGQIFISEHAIRTIGGRQLSMARSEIGLIFAIAGSSPARAAIASLGRSSEVQTILVACGEMAPLSHADPIERGERQLPIPVQETAQHHAPSRHFTEAAG